MSTRTSTLVAPEGVWWTRLGRDERLWVAVTVVWALVMFVIMMFVWPLVGRQQVPRESYRVDPAAFHALTETFVQQYRVGEMGGVPVVEPPPGGDVYLEASRFQFRPVVRLKKGETYRFLISSLDVQHGFSLQPDNLNLQVLPGYVQAVWLTPQRTGEYSLVCNEYCGLGHHVMSGRIVVTE
ncbi:MAG: cytochrome C oxidase subunit II [Clostridia bacterium]|nr:cytochrome C oxidase subunit II [Clostridia bacterium]